MNKQKKYFYNFLIVFLVFSIVVIGSSLFFILKIKSPHPHNYANAHLDKMELLKATQGKKRIIFVGGSNVAFGLNSEIIKEQFPQYEIINTGVLAGIGLRYMLDDTKKYLTNQDLLIIAPEYEQFYGGFGGDALWEVMSAKQSLEGVGVVHFIKLLPSFLRGFVNVVLAQENSSFGKVFIYDHRGFNKYGDYVEHWKYKSADVIPASGVGGEELDESFLLFFQKFRNEMEDRGVEYIILPPVMSTNSFQINKKQIEMISGRKEVNFYAQPAEFELSDNFFFNTNYHPNKKGVDIRTEKIITILKRFFENRAVEK